MPIPSPLALLSASAAVRFSRVVIYLNAQILLKSFRKEFENSTSRGTREVQRWTSLFFVPPSRIELCEYYITGQFGGGRWGARFL